MTHSSPLENHLLAALPQEVQCRLFPNLERISLARGEVLYEPGNVLNYAYFPTNSIVSLLYEMADGSSAEIAMVGNEGLVGVAVFMGGESTPSRAVVLGAGHAYRASAAGIKDEFNRHGEMLLLMLRYTQSLISQMAQTAVCNRHHSINQQLSRFLLLLLDRIHDNSLTMTQDVIASMLGVRREGITAAAGKLQKLGAIEYHRGHIVVLDRKKLEQICCECYRLVRSETERLLPSAQPHESALTEPY